MPSSNSFPEPGADPLAPLGELIHWLAATTIHVALGLLLGSLGARLLRRRHLHWSWSAVAFVFVMSAQGVLAGLTPVLAMATLVATLRGRWWHHKDLEAGIDLAETAARRVSPRDVLERSLRTLVERGAGWLKDGELIVGSDERGRPVSVAVGGDAGGTHTLVVGAAGSGKTVTQTWITVRAIEQGMGAVVVDPKGDGEMYAEVRRAAREAGRRFISWSPSGPSVYNPYADGSDTEIADKLLAGERFTEPHYLRQAQRYLAQEVRVLHANGLQPSLAGLVDHLDPARLEVLARSLEETRARAVHAYLDSLTPGQRSGLSGVRDRLAIMAESDAGEWLDPMTSGAERFDLREALRDRAVVYFSLQADQRPLLAQMLGAAIVQDLQTTVAASQGCPAPSLVVIDEFSAVAAEQVARLFARARSAGMSLLLGTQELSDLRLPGRETLLEQVLGNLTTLIAHRQVVPDSAELVANLAGNQGVWRTSSGGDGRMTRTRVRAQILDPDQVRGLSRGRAAVVKLTSTDRVAIAQMCRCSPSPRRAEGRRALAGRFGR
jgi:conjugal transfer pilus assembly protein TraD